MKKRLLAGLAVGLMVLGMAGVAGATPIELVTNGEFELPDFTGDWTSIANGGVPGWSNSSGRIELWNQGMIGSPSLGSDGLATGQHHEVAYNSDTNYTTQGLLIASNGTLDFSFDSWKRDASGINFSLTGSLSGLLASGSHIFTTNA